MSAPWSAEQRRCLDALGYVVYERAPPPGAREEALRDEPPRVASRPPPRAATRPAAARPAANLRDAILRTAIDALGSPVEAKAWLASADVPPLANLREPAVKRALWARLRQLRRERTPP